MSNSVEQKIIEQKTEELLKRYAALDKEEQELRARKRISASNFSVEDFFTIVKDMITDKKLSTEACTYEVYLRMVHKFLKVGGFGDLSR